MTELGEAKDYLALVLIIRKDSLRQLNLLHVGLDRFCVVEVMCMSAALLKTLTRLSEHRKEGCDAQLDRAFFVHFCGFCLVASLIVSLLPPCATKDSVK